MLSVSSSIDCQMLGRSWTNLIDGGEPAGINTLPGDEGCRRNKMIINIKAIKGKTSTRTSGTETVFRRIRRRSKALGEKRLVFSCDTSLNELGNDGGLRCFVRRSTKPIGASGGGGEGSVMVSGMLTAGGFGRDTVERRRGLSRPLRVSSFGVCSVLRYDDVVQICRVAAVMAVVLDVQGGCRGWGT
jgi:hypothetical protein